MKTKFLVNLTLLLACVGALSVAGAEEYMKRGASVEDYEQALNRVMERKRGLTTGRERQTTAGSTAGKSEPAPSKARAASSHQAPARSSALPAPKATRAAQTGSASPPKSVPDVYVPDPNETDSADGVSIYFGYNSDQLTNTAMSELEKLGQALTAPQFSGVYWLVEGHSDDSGSADYNQGLSERRARSAQQYLVEKHGIEPEKLIAVGKGESEPYDRDNPTASVNRRVRLRPAGG